MLPRQAGPVHRALQPRSCAPQLRPRSCRQRLRIIPAASADGSAIASFSEQDEDDHQPQPQPRALPEELRSLSCAHGAGEDGGLPRSHTSRRGVTNRVQLSTYADSIGADLGDLTDFLRTHIRDAIGSLHLLPLYPSTGDRGFAPITYQSVDPAFGSWGDVEELASDYQLCLEFMVNHVSPASDQFRDYVARGAASPHADMFVRWRDVWPAGAPSAEELALVRTRKPAPPVLAVTLADGSTVPLWCTFSDQQIDINPFTPQGWRFTAESLTSLCARGAKLIRLDAFGYCTKRAGTSCFMLEPEVYELLERIRALTKPYGVQLLCEVHEDFNLNIELARHGFWVYDFALPMLVLHGLRFGTALPLQNWLSICPRRQITTLDTHDGMGVDDVTGLAPLVDVREVEHCILNSGGTVNYKHFYRKPSASSESATSSQDELGACSVSSAASLQAVAEFLQPDCLQGCYTSVEHQFNSTYFSAVQEDPQQYLLARAIQFFTPGVPMVFVVGLLAGVNDYDLLARGSIRDIGRHSYTLEEAEQAVQRPVVQALLKLCRFRNAHPAFKGRVFIDGSTPDHVLRVVWYLGADHLAVLHADMASHAFSISHTPYACPDEAEEEFHSDFSLDLASVFSVDAADLPRRAALRRGMIDPDGPSDTSDAEAGWLEDLLRSATAVAESSAAAADSSSNGQAGRTDGGSDGGGGGNGGSGWRGFDPAGLQVLDLAWAWEQPDEPAAARGGGTPSAAATA